jgi:hypothetical protein
MSGVVGQAEVVIGAEVDDLALAAPGALDADDRLLRRGDDALFLVEPALLQGLGLSLQVLKKARIHGRLLVHPVDAGRRIIRRGQAGRKRGARGVRDVRWEEDPQ